MEIKEIPRGQLSTIILSTLLDGDKYGYEIIKDIETKSGGKIKIKQPSLYSSLTRMENQKLISSYWRDSDIGGKRHYYRLTDFGRKQTEQWQNDFINSNSVVSGLFKDGENGENFKLKEEPVKEEKQEEPKFLQQENLFSQINKTEKKQEETTSQTPLMPDLLDIFELANKVMEEEKKKNEKVEIQEEFVPPPEKHYNVYQELNQLRKQNEISSFAENIKEDYDDDADDVEELNEIPFNKSFAESLKSDTNETLVTNFNGPQQDEKTNVAVETTYHEEKIENNNQEENLNYIQNFDEAEDDKNFAEIHNEPLHEEQPEEDTIVKNTYNLSNQNQDSSEIIIEEK